MGTKTGDRKTTNPLGLKSIERSRFITFGVNGKRKSSKETLTNNNNKSMDRFLEKQNVETIRYTMKAQEDVFKQQVRELHRVYNTQKVMMDQLKKDRSQYWTINKKDQTTGSSTCHNLEESDLELTLSIGMSSSSTSKNMDHSSTTSDNCNNNNNNQENSGSNTHMSSSSTTSLDRDKKRSHWLFQGLSINPTS
ncbi:unnamed protein product [Cochlearia groenlandica]